MTEAMDPARIEAELREILRDYVRYPERPIQPGDHLVYDLEIDDDDASFDLIPAIHRHFGIDPPASAWWTAGTVAGVVELIERYQVQPMTPEERAREQAEQREADRIRWRSASRFLGVVGTAGGMALAGRGEGFVLLMLAVWIYFIARLPLMWRDDRAFRRDRAAWKARRAAESRG
jgi:acyl carrier protein